VNAVSNKVEKVLVTARGAGYTYALAAVQGYTGVTANSTNQPVLRCVMPPPGGHGADAAAELGARHLGVAVTMDSALSDSRLVGKNDFRIAGLLKDPLFSRVTLTINATPTQTLSDNEVITQPSTGAFGTVIERVDPDTIVLSNVGGVFATSANIVATSANISANSVVGPGTYFDQTHRFVVLNKTAEQFVEDQVVYQPDREDSANALTQSFFNATGVLYHSNNYDIAANNTDYSLVRIVNKKGTFNNTDLLDEWLLAGKANNSAEPTSNVLSQVSSDIVYGSGTVLYIENTTPITCNTGQTETFRLILEF
jgi:hypothetical protein